MLLMMKHFGSWIVVLRHFLKSDLRVGNGFVLCGYLEFTIVVNFCSSAENPLFYAGSPLKVINTRRQIRNRKVLDNFLKERNVLLQSP